MTYSLSWLLNRLDQGEVPKYLFFWGHQPAPNGRLSGACFSQWWPASFEVEGIIYPTAEHWMMAQKAQLFGDQPNFEKIIAATSPGAAKALGREVRGFDESVWEAERTAIVVAGCRHKFGQHPALRQFLLQTRERVLVEASPVDRIWGIGLTADDARARQPLLWQGLNLLGFALMEARDQLRP